MGLLFHSQRQKMEDDPQDMGGEGNQDHPQGNTIGTYSKQHIPFRFAFEKSTDYIHSGGKICVQPLLLEIKTSILEGTST